MKIEHILSTVFWFHLLNRCPLCHSKLWKKGYPKEDFTQYYKCSKENCCFGKENHFNKQETDEETMKEYLKENAKNAG